MKIVGYLLLAITPILGYEIITFISKNRLFWLEKLGASFPIGFSFICLVSLFLNPIFGCNMFHLLFEFIISVIISFFLFLKNQQFKKTYPSQKYKPSKPALFFLFVLFLLSIYISIKAICPKSGSYISTAENDMLLEHSFIASFAYGVNKKKGFLNSVILPLNIKNYALSEYFTTIYSSFLKITGISFQQSILYPTILFFISICLLQYSFTYRISNSEFASLLSIPSIFLAGGFGFMYFLRTEHRKNQYVDFVFNLGPTYNLWGHPLLHCILTSRIVLFTMSLSILGLILLEETDLYIYSGLIGFLIFISRPQTSVVYFTLYMLYIIQKIFRDKNTNDKRPLYVVLLFPLLVFVTFYLFYRQKVPFENGSNLPLYHQRGDSITFLPPISYAIRIFGLLFICLLFSVKNWRTYLFLIVFYVYTIIPLQRDIRFNFFALITVVVPLLSAVSHSGLSRFAKNFKNEELQGFLYCLIIICSCFMWLSSLAGLYSRLGQTMKVWTKSGKELDKWVRANTKENAVFCTPNMGWNPAIVRSGRISYSTTFEALQSAKFIPNGKMEDIINWLNGEDITIAADYLLIKKKSPYYVLVENKLNVLESLYENRKYHLYRWKNNAGQSLNSQWNNQGIPYEREL